MEIKKRCKKDDAMRTVNLYSLFLPIPKFRTPSSQGPCTVHIYKLEIRVRSNPSPVSQFLYLLKYLREIENANICISPTFQETVGTHLKSSLPVVVMATLNQFNSNLFCGFSKQ